MKSDSKPLWPKICIGLSTVGLAISAYLWSAKAGGAPLICGEFGDCVTVNTSVWSTFLGLPVAAWGTGMYFLLGVTALAVERNPAATGPGLIGFGLAVIGALFSLHLTVIEAFVLGAYCVWCLISWVVVTGMAIIWGRGLWKRAHPDGRAVSGKAARKQRRRA